MLAPTPLATVLSTSALTEMCQSFLGAQPRPMLGLFEGGRPLTTDLALSTGDSIATWDQVTGRRHLAGFVGGSSPAQEVERVGVETKTSACAHIKLFKRLPGSVLLNENAPGMMRPDAQAIVRMAMQDMANTIADTIERACGLILSTGKFTASKANFPDTQMIFDLDFGASSNTAFTRSAAWATTSTKIVSNDVPLPLKRSYINATGEDAGHVVYGPTVEAAILANVEFQALAAQQAGMTIIQGAGLGATVQQFKIGGLNWVPTSGTFKPRGGSVTPFFPADTIAVLPNNLGDTLGMAYGRAVVPSGQVFGKPGNAAASLLTLSEQGVYSWAEVQGNGVVLHAGIVFLPVNLNPINLMRGSA